MNKAIHYFTLAANNHYTTSQFNIGLIYYNGKYVKQDINKAIQYLTLAAKNYYSHAQFLLGIIYNEGTYVSRDMNKAIHYYWLAAKQNFPQAQFILGIIYYFGQHYQKDIKKGIDYIILASKNGIKEACFIYGFLLHEGKDVKKNIAEAIHFYKEASTFNDQYAKNNLGIIYKYGYDTFQKNIANAIEYFDEAIQKNDYLSMYNLAHIYIYDKTFKNNIDKSIELLIKSSNKFHYSMILLCLVLIKQFGFDFDYIKQVIQEKTAKNKDLSFNIYQFMSILLSFDKSIYESQYELFRKKDFLYNAEQNPIQSSDLQNIKSDSISKLKDITSSFYEGFYSSPEKKDA